MLKRLKFISLIIIISPLIYLIFFSASNIFAGNQIWTTGGPTNGRERDLAIGKNNIYTSGYNGIWKSENKGLSWLEKNNGIPTPYDVNNIETDFNNDNLVFAGTWDEGLYKSIDSGDSWTKLNSFPGNYIRKLRIDPSNENILYVGADQYGTIYKTIDGGNSWQELNLGTKGIIAYITIEPANNQVITAGVISAPNPGRYRSEDGGITWIKFSNESTIAFPDFPTPNPQVYYKILSNKLYVSLDRGISWSTTSNIGLPTNFQISYLTIDHYDANRIFLFSTQHGVYESKDAGYSWNTIGSFTSSSFMDLYIDKNNPATIYITTNGSGVWQYTLSEIIPTPKPTLIPTPTPTPTPTPLPLQPIILLPGLGGSWNHENMVLGIEKPQSEWYMTPGIKIYDGLIETLKNAGYKTNDEDKNLFVFNYNWTKPVNSISEDLKLYIENVVKPDPNEEIDLIGHSLGGLIARTYIQNNQENPIDQLITLGSPLKGIPSLYYPWEGGDLGKSLPGWQKIGAGLMLHLRKSGFSTTMEAIRTIIPSLKDMLPTFNYLKENSQEKLLNQMSQKNDWLIELNNFLPSYLTSATNNLIGILSNSTIRWINIGNRNWIEKILGIWPDGKPISDELASGDQAVLAESAFLEGAAVNNLEDLGHQELITSEVGQQKIMEVLNLNPSSISDLSNNLDYHSSLVFQIASPATINIIDPNGNPAGEGDGKLMIIANPLPGEYQINLNGISSGSYKLYIGQIFENQDFWTTIPGLINEGDNLSYKINFNPSSLLKNPLIDRTGEIYLQMAKSQIFDLKNEINQQSLHPLIKRLILLQLNKAEFWINKNKIEKSIYSLYRLRFILSVWQNTSKLEENKSVYLKNKIQDIIVNLEEAYIISETKKGKIYNQHHLRAEIVLAQKMFNKLGSKIQKLSEEGVTNPDLGTLYLLAQKKLNEARNSTSYRSHINNLGIRFLSQEGMFLIK
jgi:photosystem II stability/assembly factor-like uncharacterized protein/pimeloyl-ACP methyl ester carboxylesterase